MTRWFIFNKLFTTLSSLKKILVLLALQVLYEQFKFFLNFFFLVMACSQFIPEIRVGYLYTYWGPLVSICIIRARCPRWVLIFASNGKCTYWVYICEKTNWDSLVSIQYLGTLVSTWVHIGVPLWVYILGKICEYLLGYIGENSLYVLGFIREYTYWGILVSTYIGIQRWVYILLNIGEYTYWGLLVSIHTATHW